MATISNVAMERVTKLFGEMKALSQISLTVKSGDAVAVMGANGAGKSTLLGLLSLQARPTRGRVLFNGEPASTADAEIRSRIGLLSHDPLVYPDLTARANLAFFARLYGLADIDGRIEALSASLDLADFLSSRPTRLLSRGQLQRVALARALLPEPDLLLLDEPAAGLDTAAIRRIETAVGQLIARGGMAVIVTHEPEVAQRIANRGIMMRRGETVAQMTAPADIDTWRKCYFEAVGGGAA